MNKFVEDRIKKYKKSLISSVQKKEIFDNIYKVANEIQQEWWQDCGLLPSHVIDNKDFCEWLKINKPISYQNGLDTAKKDFVNLEKLHLNIILAYVTGGNAIFVSTGSSIGTKSGIVSKDPSSEYSLVTGSNGEIEEEREVELIAEYATFHKPSFDYLELCFRDNFEDFEEDYDEEEDDY